MTEFTPEVLHSGSALGPKSAAFQIKPLKALYITCDSDILVACGQAGSGLG